MKPGLPTDHTDDTEEFDPSSPALEAQGQPCAGIGSEVGRLLAGAPSSIIPEVEPQMTQMKTG